LAYAEWTDVLKAVDAVDVIDSTTTRQVEGKETVVMGRNNGP
jgi:hypothetical protein